MDIVVLGPYVVEKSSVRPEAATEPPDEYLTP
jgi:hypothetical protein